MKSYSGIEIISYFSNNLKENHCIYFNVLEKASTR